MKKRLLIYILPLVPAILFGFMGVLWLSALSFVALMIIFVVKSENRYLAGFRRKKWMTWPSILLGVFLMAILFKTLVLCIYKIPSSSMERTIMKGDIVWVNKFIYGPKLPKSPYEIPWFSLLYWVTHREQKLNDAPKWDYRRLQGFGQMERGDVIVFEHPDNMETYIKRCVALPGDTFKLVHESVINNKCQN
jgi:signal peptidase I